MNVTKMTLPDVWAMRERLLRRGVTDETEFFTLLGAYVLLSERPDLAGTNFLSMERAEEYRKRLEELGEL